MIDISWRPKLNPDGTIAFDQDDDDVAKHYGPGDHPSGSSQDAHAGSRLIPIDPTADQFPDLDNTMKGMPLALSVKVKNQAEKYLGSKRQIMARFRKLLRAAMKRSDAESGVNWYSETHTWLEGLAQQHGFTTEQAAGATAAMSSGLRWEAAPGKASNKAAVDALMRHMAEDKPLSAYGVDIEVLNAHLEKDALGQRTKARGAIADYEATIVTGKTRLSDLTNPRETALVWSAIWRTEGYSLPAQYGYDPYMDAIEILRGAPPGDFLAGPKRRSFYNNLMLIPNDDVTIDVQMIGAARGRAINSQVLEDKTMQTSVVGTPKLGNIGVGVHPLLADYVRELTDEVNTSTDDPWDNVLPMQIQAVLWTEFKTRNAASD